MMPCALALLAALLVSSAPARAQGPGPLARDGVADAEIQELIESEARMLLEDLNAWSAFELPAPEDLHALREVADGLCAAQPAAHGASLTALVRALGELGHRLGQAGRREEAHALVQWIGERALSGGDPATAGWALDWLGQEAWVRGELELAAAWIARAAEVDGARGAAGEHTRHLADVARIRLTQGRFDEALASAERAEEVARASGSERALRTAAEIRGGMLLELDRHREALELCFEHLAREGAPDEPRVRLEILLSDVLADVGRLETAVAHARRAHEVALAPEVLRLAPLLHLEAKLSLGLLLGDLGRCAEALEVLDAATAEFERLGDLRGVGWAAKNRGFALFAAGRFAEALPAFEAAWHAGTELGVPFLAGIGALGTAEARVLGGMDEGPGAAEVEDALASVERVARTLHERTLEWRCAALRGRRWLARGEPERALPELTRAVQLVERWRRRLGVSGLVEHALRQRSDPYRDAAFAAARLGRTEEALGFAGLLHARVLDELRAREDGPLSAPRGAVADLRERVARAEFELRQGGAHASTFEGTLARTLAQAEDELDAALLAEEIASGRTLEAARARLPLAELGLALEAQGFDLALVYLVGPQETLVLSLAAGAARVEARHLSVGQAQLDAWIRALREPLARLEDGQLDLAHLGFDVAAARALYAHLVAPLALRPGARIALVTDGALGALPFELFVSGGESGRFELARPFAHLAGLDFLGDAHTFVSFGSLVRLLRPVPPRAGATVVLVAPGARGPRHAREEARAIARELPGTRIVTDAGVEDVVAHASAARLHFAVHGRLDAARPAGGRLLLGQAAELESWQVAELDLTGAAIVLSACHSGGGAWRAGAGLAGLTRGFFLAGAREVVASAWAVDDQVTARFMELHYAALARGLDTPAALAAARSALRAESDPRGFALAHPAFWAAWSVHR